MECISTYYQPEVKGYWRASIISRNNNNKQQQISLPKAFVRGDVFLSSLHRLQMENAPPA